MPQQSLQLQVILLKASTKPMDFTGWKYRPVWSILADEDWRGVSLPVLRPVAPVAATRAGEGHPRRAHVQALRHVTDAADVAAQLFVYSPQETSNIETRVEHS